MWPLTGAPSEAAFWNASLEVFVQAANINLSSISEASFKCRLFFWGVCWDSFLQICFFMLVCSEWFLQIPFVSDLFAHSNLFRFALFRFVSPDLFWALLRFVCSDLFCFLLFVVCLSLFCLFICLLICLSVCLFDCFVSLFVVSVSCLFVCVFVCLFVYWFVCFFVCCFLLVLQPNCFFVSLFVCLSGFVFVCLLFLFLLVAQPHTTMQSNKPANNCANQQANKMPTSLHMVAMLKPAHMPVWGSATSCK